MTVGKLSEMEYCRDFLFKNPSKKKIHLKKEKKRNRKLWETNRFKIINHRKFAAFQHQTANWRMVGLEPLIDQIPDECVYILTYRSISSPEMSSHVWSIYPLFIKT